MYVVDMYVVEQLHINQQAKWLRKREVFKSIHLSIKNMLWKNMLFIY